MNVVIKHIDGRDCGMDRDGTCHTDPSDAELLNDSEARELAIRIGGSVVDERDMWPQDWD